MSQTILIADDSNTVRTIVKMAFKASGYDVAEQGEGANVLSTVQSTRPDILILDYFFPDADGYDICRELKENPATAGVPILMLGGKYKQFNEGLARTSGADAILMKPFKTDSLLQAVEEAKAKAAENSIRRSAMGGAKPSSMPPMSPGATRFAGSPPASPGAPATPMSGMAPRFGAPPSSPAANSAATIAPGLAATVGPANLPPMSPTGGSLGGKPDFGAPAASTPASSPFTAAGNSNATFAPPSAGFGSGKPATGFGAGGFGAGVGGVMPQVPPPAEGPPSQDPVLAAAPPMASPVAPAPVTPAAPAAPASPAPAASAAAPSGELNADFVRQIVREEIAAFVKDELPTLVQNVLGGPIQRKLLYKMIARADERYDEVVRGAVHNQVIIEIEKLLNETN